MQANADLANLCNLSASSIVLVILDGKKNVCVRNSLTTHGCGISWDQCTCAVLFYYFLKKRNYYQTCNSGG